MKLRLAFLSLFLLSSASIGFIEAPAIAPDIKADAKADSPKTIKLADGSKFKLVDREQLRIKSPNTRTLTIPKLKALVKAIPTPPALVDWTKGNTVDYPILGNDQYGDCYYVSMAHHHQTFGGAIGKPVVFDRNTLVKRYLKVSGGDNGLSDYDIFGQNRNGEWYSGIIGPNGPYKILDHMVIDHTDAEAIKLGMWAFGGVGYTCSLLNSWENNIKPGAVWDSTGVIDRWAGHAMLLNGYDDKSNFKCQTWALNPPISLTYLGMKASDPELYIVFSLSWFDPETGKAPNGLHYVDAASLWVTLGGHTLPPNPFPGPAPIPPIPPTPIPPVPPTPPVPGSGFTGTLVYKDGVLVSVVPGGTVPAPSGVEAELKQAGVSPVVIVDVLKLLADLKAKASRDVLLADILKIIMDLSTP